MRAQFFDKLKSSIKNDSEKLQVEDLTEKVFGTDRDKSNEENGGYAGSVIVSDAKILAFPMRSNIAPFVWITCPSVLNRLSKDIVLAGKEEEKIECVAGIEEEKAIILKGDVSEEKVLLEDIEVTIDTSSDSIREKLSPILKYLEQANRLLLVSDKVFVLCVILYFNNCTDTDRPDYRNYQKRFTKVSGGVTIRYNYVLCNILAQ